MLNAKSILAKYRKLQRLYIANLNLHLVCKETRLNLNRRKNKLVNSFWEGHRSRGELSDSNNYGIRSFKSKSLSIIKSNAVIIASVQIKNNKRIIKNAREMLADILKYEEVYIECDTSIFTIGN